MLGPRRPGKQSALLRSEADLRLVAVHLLNSVVFVHPRMERMRWRYSSMISLSGTFSTAL